MTARGKTVLITGSTDGVGRRVAERLAQVGTTVLIHGRDHARAERLLAEIRNAGGTGAFYPADLSSLSEVRSLAEALRRDHGRLDILINNAGIGVGRRGSGRQASQDGHELRFAVNYLSGFLLTRLLLPLLKATGTARIINVSSVGQQPIDFADVMLTHGYSGTRASADAQFPAGRPIGARRQNADRRVVSTRISSRANTFPTARTTPNEGNTDHVIATCCYHRRIVRHWSRH